MSYLLEPQPLVAKPVEAKAGVNEIFDILGL